MNYVISIDASKMPKPLLPPPVAPTVQGEGPAQPIDMESRANAVDSTPQRQRPPFRFDNWKASTPNEARATE